MSFNHTCEPCSLDQKKEIVKGFCVICVDYLCEDCVKSHSKNKATRKHTILCDHDLPDNKSAYQLLASMLLCKTHPERKVQFECKDHSEFVCALCIRQAHRHCENVDDIDELVDDENEKTKCKLILDSNTRHSNDIDLLKKKMEEHIKALVSEKSRYGVERKRIIQQIHGRLKKLDKKLANKYDECIAESVTPIKEMINKCSEDDQILKQERDMLEISMKYANEKQLKVIASRSTAKRFEKTYRDCIRSSLLPEWNNNVLINISESIEREVRENFSYKANSCQKPVSSDKTKTKITKSRNSLNPVSEINESDECRSGDAIEEIGQPCRKDAESQTICFGVDMQIPDTQSKHNNKAKTDTLKADKIKTIPKKGDTKSRYAIRQCSNKSLMEREIKLANTFQFEDGLPHDCLILPSGRFVFAGNGKPDIRVHSQDFEIVSQLELRSKPCKLCLLEENECALSYLSDKRVDRFLILDDKIEKLSGFNTKLYCRGVARFDDDSIAVLCSSNAAHEYCDSVDETIEVQIRNKNNGQIIKTLNQFDDPYGNEIVLNNPFTILSIFKDTVFIADTSYLRLFNENGVCEVFFTTYKGHNISDISGLTMDNEGNLYACGYRSNNVHQMRVSNLKQNRVLVGKICEPIWVVFDSRRDRLVIGCGDEKIRVYIFK